MEHHGEIPRKQVVAIIPARYDSTRLPGKMLLPIDGKPLIIHTVERAAAAKGVEKVIVATDNQQIADAVLKAGHEAVLTSPNHLSGSDRIAEVAEKLPKSSIIVNIQGDEPLILPETVDKAVVEFQKISSDVVTVYEPLRSLYGELLDFNVVKAVAAENGRALYFSRSPMPFPRDASLRYGGNPNQALENEPELFEIFKKHVGLYVYSREFLLHFTKLPQTKLEKFESLEQLRALENGARITLVEAAAPSIGVDTLEDFERVKDIIEARIDIRQVSREDLPRVAEVHVESWQRSFAGIAPNGYLRNMSIERRLQTYSERRCDEAYSMLVAVDAENGIVGFADFGKPTLSADFDSQIYSFYFLPEFQRRGFGERLFRRCVSQMTKNGVRSLCLDSLEISPYRKFYDKLGGKIVGRDRHVMGEDEFETVIYGWEDITKI